MKDKQIYKENDIIDLFDTILDSSEKKEYVLSLLNKYSIYNNGGHLISLCKQHLKSFSIDLKDKNDDI